MPLKTAAIAYKNTTHAPKSKEIEKSKKGQKANKRKKEGRLWLCFAGFMPV